MQPQSINNRYISLGDLQALLERLFGAGNFRIREEESSYEINVPELLTEHPEAVSQRLVLDAIAMDVTTVVEEIEKIRDQPDCKNIIDAKHFVPESALLAILSENNIRRCLQELGILRDDPVGLVQNILNGARKCFAILLLIDRGLSITGFFRHDEMQSSTPDDRLPYTKEVLQRIFREGLSPLNCIRTVTKFLERQWEFAIPILREDLIFREFQTDVILPYVTKEYVGKGSMGTAWKFGVHPRCHKLPMAGHEILVKEINRSLNEDNSVFKKELENLSLLTHLKHPNIVRLYCSYILRDTCNLVFSIADSGSLDEMLNGLSQPTLAMDKSQLLLGLANLASAIHAMHNFTSTTLPDLHLTGCHHDLAPRNILVHGTTLLLADFGLSSFRAADMDSLTMFRDVRGSYVAPECQAPDRHGHFQSQNIGRASDIWSLGCILAEVLTFITSGTSGVRQFRDSRMVKVLGVEWYRFHRGPGEPNPKVDEWLVKLGQQNEEANQVFSEPMLSLIRRMLSIDPSQRPRSAYVLSALQGISILALATLVDKAWEALGHNLSGANYALEKTRFKGWLYSFRQLFDETIEKNLELTDTAFDFVQTVQALQELLNIARSSNPREQQQQPLLRYQTTRLLASLPPSYRSAAKGYLVRQIMRRNDQDWLDTMTGTVLESMKEDIGVLAAVRYLTLLAERGLLIKDSEVKKLVMNEKDIKVLTDVDLHSLATVESTTEQVLVEWLDYKEEWADEKVGPELRNRAGSVVALLNSPDVARTFGALRCKGILHAASRRAFGLVYALPLKVEPVTLNHLFCEKDPRTKDKRYRPLLEYRFQLARSICQSISTLHNAGWVHRNLHTMNVIFFPAGNKDEQLAKDPYISGLGASRESRKDTFTVGADEARQLRKYQHPKYLAGERFREAFDYYSIGIMLLEIGFWDTVSEMTSSEHTRRFKDLGDDDFRKAILKSRVPKLGITVGSQYMEATRACLNDSLDVGSSAECQELFKVNVVDLLQSFG